MAGKKKVFVAAVIALIGIIAFGGPALAGTMLSGTPLTGEAEVDGEGNPNQGDLDGSGTAELNLIPKREKICYQLTVTGIESANAAHIHKAPAGQNGPIVKELRAPSDGDSQGCVRLGRKKIMQIKNNPSVYYVNVHNVPFPNGALRGQLHN
jgi:hypothetical protein